jgi:hypothetical protein
MNFQPILNDSVVRGACVHPNITDMVKATTKGTKAFICKQFLRMFVNHHKYKKITFGVTAQFINLPECRSGKSI